MNTNDEEYVEGDWLKAGEIAAEALAFGEELIKKGNRLLVVCDKIDDKIIELGGIPAFPTQISCNEIAAHYCPAADDEIIFEDQVCCLDVGASVNGAIGDNALTVDLSGKHADLVKASRDALNNAIKVIQPGVRLGDIGKEIVDTITSYGFSPVKNLSGHGLGVYGIHTKPTVPNFDTGDPTTLEEGDIIAIEPFATDGKGMIYESGQQMSTIYALINKRPVRNLMVRDILKDIESYKGLPFTTRWLTKKFPVGKVTFSLRQLSQLEIIKDYPPLIEQAKGLVSQAEHSVIVKDKPIILTKKS